MIAATLLSVIVAQYHVYGALSSKHEEDYKVRVTKQRLEEAKQRVTELEGMVETQEHSADELALIDRLILRTGRMRRASRLWVPKSTVYVRDDVREVPVAHRSVRSMRGKFSVTYPAPSGKLGGGRRRRTL